jgi:hypothetical protein
MRGDESEKGKWNNSMMRHYLVTKLGRHIVLIDMNRQKQTELKTDKD